MIPSQVLPFNLLLCLSKLTFIVNIGLSIE
jgi:hypothetical protein